MNTYWLRFTAWLTRSTDTSQKAHEDLIEKHYKLIVDHGVEVAKTGNLEQENARLQQDLDITRAAVKTLEMKLSDQQDELERTRIERDEVTAHLTDILAENETLREVLLNLRASIKARDLEVSALHAEKTTLQLRNADLQRTVERATQKVPARPRTKKEQGNG